MKTVFSKKHSQDPELLVLRSELLEAQGELAQAYRQFNSASIRSARSRPAATT